LESSLSENSLKESFFVSKSQRNHVDDIFQYLTVPLQETRDIHHIEIGVVQELADF
jgi:ubiquinone biosynthesis protein Coq4